MRESIVRRRDVFDDRGIGCSPQYSQGYMDALAFVLDLMEDLTKAKNVSTKQRSGILATGAGLRPEARGAPTVEN